MDLCDIKTLICQLKRNTLSLMCKGASSYDPISVNLVILVCLNQDLQINGMNAFWHSPGLQDLQD